MKRFRQILSMFKNTLCAYYSFKRIKINILTLIKLERKTKTYLTTNLFGNQIIITDRFWYLHGLKEIFIEEVYKFRSDTKNPLIIDCGSNVGLSIIYFKRLFPDAKIIGFEPDNLIFKILENNINQFKLNDVKLYQKAVWINDKPLLFKQNGSVGGHITDEMGNNSIRIETHRLKELLDQNIDFLKIDIEGSEFEIIKDCEDRLSNVQNIFIEYHSFHETPQMIGELLIMLKNAGFKVYIKEAWENMRNPFIEKKGPYFDLQLNIFGYRR